MTIVQQQLHGTFLAEASGNTFIVSILHDANMFSRADMAEQLFRYDRDTYVVISVPGDRSASMRIFERDGSESDICGNALRVAAKLLKQEYGESSWRIMTRGGLCQTFCNDSSTQVYFPPMRFHGVIPTPFGQAFLTDSGEPHLVLMVQKELFDEALAYGEYVARLQLPRGIRHSTYNLTVAYRGKGQHLYAQTFERGVNAPTLACGTGAYAAAFLFQSLINTAKDIFVIMPGGTITVNPLRQTISGNLPSLQPLILS